MGSRRVVLNGAPSGSGRHGWSSSAHATSTYEPSRSSESPGPSSSPGSSVSPGSLESSASAESPGSSDLPLGCRRARAVLCLSQAGTDRASQREQGQKNASDPLLGHVSPPSVGSSFRLLAPRRARRTPFRVEERSVLVHRPRHRQGGAVRAFSSQSLPLGSRTAFGHPNFVQQTKGLRSTPGCIGRPPTCDSHVSGSDHAVWSLSQC
jgi:hypothetical protein